MATQTTTGAGLISADWHDFQTAVKFVAAAASADKWGGVLTSVLVEFDASGVTLTATDKFRMHQCTIPSAIINGEGRALIDAKQLLTAVKAAGNRAGGVSLTLEGIDWRLARTDNVTTGGVCSTLDYPRIDFWPTTYPVEVTQLGFNPEVMGATLVTIGKVFGEHAHASFFGPNKAILLENFGREYSARALVMPVRIP